MNTHARSRRALLSQLLNLPPDREVTRDVVEAAIWATLDWQADNSRVSRLLTVIDAFVDARLRSAMIIHSGRATAEDIAMPARKALSSMSQGEIAPPPPPSPRPAVLSLPPAAIITPVRLPAKEEPAIDNASLTVPYDNFDGFVAALEAEAGVSTEPSGEDNAAADTADALHDGSLDEEKRVCNSCSTPKLLTAEFRKSSQGPDGYDRRCKECRRKEERRRREKASAEFRDEAEKAAEKLAAS